VATLDCSFPLVRASPFAVTSILDRYSIGLEWFDWSKLHSLTMKSGIRGAQVFLSKIREYLDPSDACASGGRDSFQSRSNCKGPLGLPLQSLH
jgi:hypothetical protein